MRTFCDKHGNVFMSNRFSNRFQAEQKSHVLLKVNFGVFDMIVFFDDPFNLFFSFLIKRNESASHEAFTVLWNSNVVHYYCVLCPAAGRAAHFCSRCLCCHPCQDVCQGFLSAEHRRHHFLGSLSGRERPHGAIPTKCR